MDEVSRRRLLADFLRSRRARLDPVEFRFPKSNRRRTPGLRREEVATLANVGLAWYTAMEQAKDIHPSVPVLGSLARVLRLSRDEARHLFFLAGQLYPEERLPAPGTEETLPPMLSTILEQLAPLPAYVLDSYWTYRAANFEAVDLFGLEFPGQNLVREFFLAEGKRRLYPQWDEVAAHIVSEFRADIEGQGNPDSALGLVDELAALSPPFARLWRSYPILGTQDRVKTLNHPRRGPQRYLYTTFLLAAHQGLRLVVYTPLEPPGLTFSPNGGSRPTT